MNLHDFVAQHGASVLVRRHFEYDNPISTAATAGGAFTGLQGALTYSRALDPAKLGLSAKGVQDAIAQGRRLAEMKIGLGRIICGTDQRNYDGARFTAAGIKGVTGQDVPCHISPAVTYPYYTDPVEVAQALEAHGDFMVHMYLAGRRITGVQDMLCTEPPEVFEARILAAVTASYLGLVLFDLNYESMVLLYYLHLHRLQRVQIPCDESAWVPTKGGGLVYGRSDAKEQVVAEFTPDLEIVQVSS